MRIWTEQLSAFACGVADADLDAAFVRLQAQVRQLGFECCAYGLRFPLPDARPRTLLASNYPVAWQRRYAQAGYLRMDPTVRHGLRSREPLVWDDAVFADTPALWSEARSAGLRVGWAQSCLDSQGVCGMLSLVRAAEPLSALELAAKELPLRGLVNLAHLTLGRILRRALVQGAPCTLTRRERQVLRWQAAGKTSAETAEILGIRPDTVKFHTRRVLARLGTPTRTAAAARAMALGLLDADD